MEFYSSTTEREQATRPIVSTYTEAIAYLERLIAAPLQTAPGAGLERTRLLLNYLGNPQQRLRTLHVTGSSGKGSTVALSAAILQAAGYRVGVFSSPHLVSYTERISIDGVAIAEDDWAALLRDLQPMIAHMSAAGVPGYTLGRPALIQVLWPMAAHYFATQSVDVAVVEVGMGGRYDATTVNVAQVAVVTNVSLEHTQQLGETVAEIAAQKAGVAKPGGWLITGSDDRSARSVIAAECARLGTELWTVGQGDDDTVCWTPRQGAVQVQTPQRRYDALHLALLGRHQYANAACAIAAIEALTTAESLSVSAEAVRHALATTTVPGRLERVADDPLTILDGAHNPAEAQALAVALHDLFPARPLVLLLGILGDKDIVHMVPWLAALAISVIVTEPPWAERAGQGAAVAAQAARYAPEVIYRPEVATALATAQQRARKHAAPLIVCGSLILVGAVRPLILEQEGRV